MSLAICFTTSAQADVFHAPADYPTIQAALDASSQGDEINTAPGFYDGFYVSQQVLLYAQPGTTITSRVWIAEPGPILDGFRFLGGVTAIEPFSMTNCEFSVSGFYISGAYGPPPTIYNSSFASIAGKGVSLDYADALLDQCHFQDVGQQSISLSNTCQVWVSSSVFVDNGPLDGSAARVTHPMR